MAHVKSSIELDAPVDTIHQEWLAFEALPRSPVHSMVEHLRWRAEVLTFEPMDSGTRVTLKIEYDPTGDDERVARRLDAVMQSFTAFFERRHASVAGAQPA